MTLNGHTDDVLKVRFNEQFIVSGSQDRTIKVWNINTGKCLRTLTGHRGKRLKKLSLVDSELIYYCRKCLLCEV